MPSCGPRRRSRLVGSLEARRWDRICDQYVSDAVQAIVLGAIEGRFDERTGARARRLPGPVASAVA